MTEIKNLKIQNNLKNEIGENLPENLNENNEDNFSSLESKNDEILKVNEKKAVKVSVFTLVANTFLSIFKLIAGLFGASYAMVADAIHSFSDVFTTIIVIASVKVSAKKADKSHPYGHDRFECVAALILAFILFDVGLLIGYSAITNLISKQYLETELPKTIALVASVVSILVQVVMFAVARKVAKQINSGALKADAWHHLSDSLSSIGSFIGIFGAMMGFPILDVLASLVICLIILKVSISIFVDAINKLTDRAVDDKTQNEIYEVAKSIDGVIHIDELRTRQFGNMIYVDMEIACDSKLPLVEAHKIAHAVHDKIEEKFKLVKHCEIHVNPTEKTK